MDIDRYWIKNGVDIMEYSGNEDYTVLYLVISFTIYFYFKSVFVVILGYVIWVLLSGLIFSSFILNGSFFGTIIGVFISVLMFKFAKLTEKNKKKIPKYYIRYVIEIIILFIGLILSEMNEIIQETRFPLGILRSYIAFTLITFCWYFANRQYKCIVNDTWNTILEYDDANSYRFITLSSYFLCRVIFCGYNGTIVIIFNSLFIILIFFIFGKYYWHGINDKGVCLEKSVIHHQNNDDFVISGKEY